MIAAKVKKTDLGRQVSAPILMYAHAKELDEHGDDPRPEGFLQKWIKSIISM